MGLLSWTDESDGPLLGAVELGLSVSLLGELPSLTLLGAALPGPLDGVWLNPLPWLDSVTLDWLLCPLGALLLDSSDASELTLLAGGLLGSLDADTSEATELTLLAGGLLGALDADWFADSLL